VGFALFVGGYLAGLRYGEHRAAAYKKKRYVQTMKLFAGEAGNMKV
jgi:hypothetical protein